MKKKYLWALPDQVTLNRIQSIIQRLAQAFNGPVFLPHITLYSGFVDSKRLEKAASHLCSPTAITILEPRYGDNFYQKIHCPCEANAVLSRWNEHLYAELGATKPLFYPHLSLFYGELSHFRVQDILRGMRLPPLTFQVQRLAIVHGDDAVQNWSLHSTLVVSDA